MGWWAGGGRGSGVGDIEKILVFLTACPLSQSYPVAFRLEADPRF